MAGAAKNEDVLSGDSFSMMELSNGKFAVALSDGMGNGVRARMESSAALSMLEQLLQSGIDERLAVKSVNSILLLRSPEEMFATIDLALIDLYSAFATMLKIGSTPTLIKRGREIIPIAANNLPIGILQDIEIDLLRLQLQPGDTLIMMTDGILDSPGHAINKELWMKRVLQELDADNAQICQTPPGYSAASASGKCTGRYDGCRHPNYAAPAGMGRFPLSRLEPDGAAKDRELRVR